MTAAASVLVAVAMTAALAVATWPRRWPTALARAVLTVLVGASITVALAAITAAELR